MSWALYNLKNFEGENMRTYSSIKCLFHEWACRYYNIMFFKVLETSLRLISMVKLSKIINAESS